MTPRGIALTNARKTVIPMMPQNHSRYGWNGTAICYDRNFGEGTRMDGGRSVKQTLFAVALTMGAYFLLTGYVWGFVQNTDGLERIGPLLLWLACGFAAVWFAMALCKVVLRSVDAF